jgi:hypothetical protein
MVAQREAQGTVILLHGFPKRCIHYKDIARELADYEVHSLRLAGIRAVVAPAERARIRRRTMRVLGSTSPSRASTHRT